MKWKFEKGSISCQAPSNIALVKYWGKKGLQLPINPSLSLTLKNCLTRATVYFEMGEVSDPLELEFAFHGRQKPEFLPKIKTFLERAESLYPFVKELKKLSIHSENSFPHSSGIASSASSFCALALCLENIQATLGDEQVNMERAGQAARLGSGSACRSVFGGYNLWGKTTPGLGLDEAAVKVNEIHPVFNSLKDAILVASGGVKKLASSAGHGLMQAHPFAEGRKVQARENCLKAMSFLKEGAVWELGALIEEEALTLHALMMSSSPGFILMRPETLHIIEAVKEFRAEEKTPLFFTLDAGPNPHLVYLERDQARVREFITARLSSFCENGKVIFDEAGEGPAVLESHFE